MKTATGNIITMAPLGKKSGDSCVSKKAVQDLFVDIPEQEKKLLRLIGNMLLQQTEEEIKNKKSHATQHD